MNFIKNIYPICLLVFSILSLTIFQGITSCVADNPHPPSAEDHSSRQGADVDLTHRRALPSLNEVLNEETLRAVLATTRGGPLGADNTILRPSSDQDHDLGHFVTSNAYSEDEDIQADTLNEDEEFEEETPED